MSEAKSLNGYYFKDEFARTKLDNDVEQLNTKIDNKTDSINTRIDNLISSGIAPIPVSNISQMTDRSKIYVLTTSGHWYYYNGSQWTDGGTYQASEDSTTVTLNTKAIESLEKYNSYIVGIPVKDLSFGYISATAGTNQTDQSRLRTDYYVDLDYQRVTCDAGYAVSAYFYDTDDVYVGRLLTDYTLSTEAASETVVMLWATDLNIAAIKGLYPNYKLKLVFRKDDYSSIQNVSEFMTHFTSYTQNVDRLIRSTENSYFDFINQNLFTIGDLNNDGTPNTSINYRMFTTDYLDERIDIIKGINNRIFKIFAFEDDVCLGRYQTNKKFGTAGTAATPSVIDLRDFRKRFPNYKFKIVAFVSGATNKTTLLQSRNVIFTYTRTLQNSLDKEITPDVKATSCPNIANHDMTWIEDKLLIFDAPSSNYNGKLSILNSDLTAYKTKYTNFNYLLKDGTTRNYLRMKSVDFNPTSNILIVSNGQVPVLTGNSKLFVFYDATDWIDSSTYDITFENCGRYKDVDISELGDRAYCFWKNYGETNEIYVTVDNLEKIYLIELGKGANNLGKGSFESTSSDLYNGSYRIVKCWKQLNNNPINLNAHGGQVYNGELYLASNNEEECTIYKCIFGCNGELRFEKLELDCFENGTSKYSYIDGMCVKNSEIYADPLHINGSYNTGTNKVLLKIKI